MPPSTRNGCKSGCIFCVRFLFARSGERRTYRYASVFLFLLPQEVCGAAGLCHKSGGCFVSGKYFTGDQKLSKKLIGRTKDHRRPLYRGSLWLLEECGHGGGAGTAEEAEAPPQAADLQGGAPLSGERAGIHRATEQQRVILMKKGIPFFRHRGLPL